MRKLPKTTLLLLLGASGLIAISGAAVGFAAWTYANAANVTPTTAGAGASATGVVNNTSTVTGSISVSGNAVAVIDDTGYTTSGSTKIYSAVAFWADAKQDYSTDASKIVAPSMSIGDLLERGDVGVALFVSFDGTLNLIEVAIDGLRIEIKDVRKDFLAIGVARLD